MRAEDSGSPIASDVGFALARMKTGRACATSTFGRLRSLGLRREKPTFLIIAAIACCGGRRLVRYGRGRKSPRLPAKRGTAVEIVYATGGVEPVTGPR